MRLRSSLLLVALLPWAAACSCDTQSLANAAGELELQPATMAFGPVFLGERRSLELELRNTGRADFTLAFESAPAGFAVAPESVTIAAGGSDVLRVTFAPTELGEVSGLLAFRDGISVPVSGTGVERALGAPETIDFGDVRVGTVKTLEFELENLVGAPLGASLSLTGTDAASFRFSPERVELGPRGVRRVEVSFTPPVRGTQTATLRFDACERCVPTEVRLRGSGAVEAVSVQPESLDFGLISPGLAATEELTVTNTGDLDSAVVWAEVLSGGEAFGVEPGSLPIELPAGASTTLPVVFEAPALGAFTGSLRLQVGTQIVDVPLTGRGGSADLAAVPASLDFGVQPAGTPETRIVTVQNVGEPGSVWVTELRLEGAGRDAFSALPDRGLPLDLGTGSLALEVRFEGGDVGTHDATLVLVTDDPDERELRIPLSGRTIGGDPCSLRVEPRSVRFGFVHAGEPHDRVVTLHNEGFTDCYVWGIGLDPAGSPDFSLVDAPADVTSIAAESSLELTVRYLPLEPGITGDDGTLIVNQVHPTEPELRLPVNGFASIADLVVQPSPVDFGASPVGLKVLRAVTLLNQGATVVRLESVGLAAGASPEFTIEGTPTLPRSIPAGAQETLHLAFLAADVGVERAELELWLENALAPVIVELQAEGNDQPCGVACEAPAASCPSPQTSWTHAQVTLSGAGSDPDGQPVTCAWQIVSAPAGAQAQIREPGSCTSTIRPDVNGDWVFELTVTDPDGLSATCQAQVRAEIYEGLWVETTWSGPDDLDLHLFHPLAGDPLDAATWFALPHDCYYSNMNPYWDDPGRADDPLLDRDDTEGTGPESVRLLTPSTTHSYTVGVHWFRSSNGNRSQDVFTNVYCGGSLVASVQSQLLYQYEAADVGTVTWIAPNSCTFRPGRWTLSVVP